MKYVILLWLLFFSNVVFAETTSYRPALQPSVIIFVSFSMPKESIKGWVREGEIIHAPVVLRGLVNNSFKDTIKKVNELIQDNHGGVQIDPTLFQRFNVNKVPAVVVVKSTICLPSQTCPDEFDVIYGDVKLEYALRKIIDKKDNLSPIAEEALKILREAKHA